MVLNLWFRLCCLGLLVAALVIALIVPKVWRVTPTGFQPVVRISLLDWLQAASLSHSATAAERRQDFQQALTDWRAACAHHPANQTMLRRFLEVIPATRHPQESLNLARIAGSWLLRLGHTNAADVALVARTWVRCGLSEPAANLLDRWQSAMPPQWEQTYLMALYQAERPVEFAARLTTNATVRSVLRQVAERCTTKPGVVVSDTRFDLFCYAYLAGWGPVEEQTAALQRLRAARREPALASAAYAVDFLLHRFLGDADACGHLLNQLERLRQDTIREHADYWDLLVQQGRKSKAAALAQAAQLTPRDAEGVYRLARAYLALDLWTQADQLIHRSRATGPLAADLAVVRAEALLRAQQWERLRSLATQLEQPSAPTKRLGGFKDYVRGAVDWQTGKQSAAATAFDHAVRVGFPNAKLALEVARGLIRLGAVRWVPPILAAHRADLAHDQAYYQLLFQCGYYLRDDRYLKEALTELRRLHPNDPVVLNNYAAVLLNLREDPAQAIRYTLRLFLEYPNSPVIRLNHAAALAMNGRGEEAVRLLQSITPKELGGPQNQAQYYLTLFEAEWKAGHPKRARRALAELKDPNLLYPAQAEWLDQAKARFAREYPGATKLGAGSPADPEALPTAQSIEPSPNSAVTHPTPLLKMNARIEG